MSIFTRDGVSPAEDNRVGTSHRQTVWKHKLFGNEPLQEGLEENNTENADEDATTDNTDENKSTDNPKPKKPKSTPGRVSFDELMADSNYKKVELPTVVATPQPTVSNTWKPPIRQTYNHVPNGINLQPGSTSDVFYSPSADESFVMTTIAKIADIITPPPPIPFPKPKREESFQTNDTDTNSDELRSPEFQGVAESEERSKSAIFRRDEVSYENPRIPSASRPEYFTIQEPLQSVIEFDDRSLKSSTDVPRKQKQLVTVWKDWGKTPANIAKLIKAMTITVNSVFETFYIPELIAVGIVNPAYNLNSHKSVYSREDFFAEKPTDSGMYGSYNNDVTTVTRQLKIFVITIFSFYAMFNWWYLIIYTNHYLDISDFLVAEPYTPINWMLGPALSPVACVNYFLLGKRLETSFYDSIIHRVVNMKWLSFTVFTILFMTLYQRFAKMQSQSFADVMKGESNESYKFLIAIGMIYYLFGVRSKAMISPFWMSMFRTTMNFSPIATFIYIIIIFILMILFLKFAAAFIIIFFMFYSYWSIAVFGGGPHKIPSIISKIITDTSDICEEPNPLNDPVTSWISWFKKHLTYILISSVYFALIIRLLDDTARNIKNNTVKGACNSIYSLLLVFQVFVIIWLNIKAPEVDIDELIEHSKKDKNDKNKPMELPNPPNTYTFIKDIIINGLRILKILLLIPFGILDGIINLYKLFWYQDSSGYTNTRFTRRPIVWLFNLINL